MGDGNNAYLMVIGDREALAWILATRQTAFPATRRGQVAGLSVGDELLLYTTRGCFRNPTRDQGRVIARTVVAGPIVHDDDPVRFAEREFPLRCPLTITELAPFGSGVPLVDHIEALHAFPDPRSWSIRLRRSPVPIDAHDHRYLITRLDEITHPIDETVGEYLSRGHPRSRRRGVPAPARAAGSPPPPFRPHSEVGPESSPTPGGRTEAGDRHGAPW